MLQRYKNIEKITELTNLYSLQTLKELVEIPSLTSNISGVSAVQGIVAQKLQELGFDIELHENPSEESAPLLRGLLKGNSRELLTIVFHADTVAKDEWKHQLYHDELGEKIFGPGVADNKGGIVMALDGLKYYLEQYKNKLNIQVICSPNEETGSNGFQELLKQWGKSSKYILGFEPALKDGGVITSRSGNKWYNIKIKGLEAHSGRKDPHVNAAHELSIKINKLHRINKANKGVRVNIGSIQSFRDTYNTVCGEVEAKMDLRFVNENQVKKYTEKIEKILTKSYVSCPWTKVKSSSLYEVTDFCPPMSSNKRNKKLKKLFLPKDKQHLSFHSGGAADINHLSHKKAYCLDGLGPLGGGMHTDQEFIKVNELDTRLVRLVELLGKINNKC